METIRICCKSCDSSIGEFTNLWTQVGKSYFSPIVDPPHAPEIESAGPARAGEKETLVEGCQLQDIACSNCATVLGIKCISSPVNHVLEENQVLFRATTVLTFSEFGGFKVDLVVKRHLKLREPPRSSTDAHSFQEVSVLQAELEAQRSDIERIDSAGFKVISGLDDAVNRVEGDLGKVRDTLSGLRQELRGNHEDLAELKSEIREVKRANTVKQLEEQLSAANHAVGAIRQELHDLATKFETQLDSLRQNTKDIDELRSLARDRVTARDHAKDMAAVRGELAQLRKQMDEGRAKPPSAFPARELDILTSNIAKIGNRASLVESLQMEFEIFKGRVERMEAAAAQSSQGQTTAPTTTASAYDRYDDHDYHPQELRSSRRKRPSSGLDTSPLPDLSSKRAAASSDMTADTITATHWTDSSPVTESRTRPDTTRQTKGGRVEKPQRPPRRSLIGENTQSKRKG